MVEDNEHIEIFEGMESLKEENQWKNWYLGYTQARLPYSDVYSTIVYRISTTAVTGSISSPFFGQRYTGSTSSNILTDLIIYLDDKIDANLTMVMEVEINTNSEDKVYFPEDRKYQGTGYLNYTWHLPKLESYKIQYQGSQVTGKPNRGFSVKWYVVDKNTVEKPDLEPRDDKSTQVKNKQFVRMVNIVHFALNNNITVESLWDQMKKLKNSLMLALESYSSDICDWSRMTKISIVEDFLDEVERSLKMPILKGAVYKDYVAESTLKIAAKIYIYLNICPTSSKKEWIQFYADLFTNFAPRQILQSLANLSKIKSGKSMTKDIPGDLLLTLREAFNTYFSLTVVTPMNIYAI